MNQLEIKQVVYQQAKKQIDRIRTEVFQIEQQISAELEFDGLDAAATQLLAYWKEEAVGTARIRDVDPQTVKIERLAVLSFARGKGIGTKLMEYAIALYPNRTIVVHAQEYIKELYLQLGFEPEGNIFTEAGIPHLAMKKEAKLNPLELES